MKNAKEQYPINEGWLHLKVNLTPGSRITQSQALAFIGLNLENAEVAKYEHLKTVVNLIARRKREEGKEVAP